MKLPAFQEIHKKTPAGFLLQGLPVVSKWTNFVLKLELHAECMGNQVDVFSISNIATFQEEITGPHV